MPAINFTNIQDARTLGLRDRMRARLKNWRVRLGSWLLGAEPLIYTKNGNVPVSGVRREMDARLTLDDSNKPVDVAIVETYFDRATGEEVKRSADVLLIKGANLGAEMARLG